MTLRVVTCREDDTVLECARRMKEFGVGFLPVTNREGVLRGVLTHSDLAERVVAEGLPLSTRARDVMTRRLLFASPHETLRRTERKMVATGKSHFPLIDRNGVCVGVLSLSDVARKEPNRRSGAVLEGIARERGAEAVARAGRPALPAPR